jgi:uncharacterized protein YndB with AHSA1/START domain
MSKQGTSEDGQRRRITLVRRYRATAEDVWDLWTPKRGIESWWGPDGFAVTVQRLDLHVGGELLYTMTATAPEQVAFMRQAGMPLATEVSAVYTEIEPMQRLGYKSLADFIPGTPSYEIGTTVSIDPEPDGVCMMLTFDAMHDEQWTERAVMGHQGELDRLDRILDAETWRRGSASPT